VESEKALIPKVIHYCWFGRGPMPTLALKCIQSWNKYMQAYKIIEWNEDNFDVNCCIYVKQAYKAKKYAFVSDYARFHILYHHGGIYMDTDVEVLRPLDALLNNQMFAGFETDTGVNPGLIFGSVKETELVKEILDSYKDRVFIKEDGTLNTETVVKYTTEILVRNGLQLNGKLQNINGMVVYPKDYFCPLDYKANNLDITHNTYTIHHFAGSWLTKEELRKKQLEKIIGRRNMIVLSRIKKAFVNLRR
jgi:mannosyltransferase OCH1-like enzyme